MGMSASQARLLSLTARLSDLEFQAQGISNSKIQLSQSSEQASEKYMDALDKQKLTVYNSDTSTYLNATAYNLTTYGAVSTLDKQRMLKTASGQLAVSEKVQKAYDAATTATTAIDFTDEFTSLFISNYLSDNSSQISSAAASAAAATGGNSAAASAAAAAASTRLTTEASTNLTNYSTNANAETIQDGFSTAASFLSATLGYSTIDEYNEQNPEATTADKTNAKNQITYYTNIYNGTEGFLQKLGYTSNANNDNDSSNLTYDAAAVKYYTNVFNEMTENGSTVINDSNLTDYEWLYSQLNNGSLFLSEYDSTGGDEGTGDWEEVSWSSGDSTLAENDDDTYIAKAEAEYNTTMAEIETKDKRFDLELKSIDTEHTAIQTEIDSVKKVIDKNIERSFKIFDA